MSQSDLTIAQNVLETEIQGLNALKEWLGESFLQAVEAIVSAKGRVIISGMGKSGHIARKIAATMASTGTSAFFVHPGEASHGDLGMVSEDDVVILLSNSGETSELVDIINYCGRFSIPLIAMVRKETSVLVEASNVALILPEVPEANAVNAPTTSTTMMLALGDAIAMALLERKSFSKDDFGVFHPGGKLGAMFTKVKDLMHEGDELPLVKADQPMSEVLLEITAKHFGCAGVINNNGELLGVITDGDLRRHMGGELMNQQASEVMTKAPVTTKSHHLASHCLAILEEKLITSLFVVDGKKPVGILHIHDLLRAGVA